MSATTPRRQLEELLAMIPQGCPLSVRPRQVAPERFQLGVGSEVLRVAARYPAAKEYISAFVAGWRAGVEGSVIQS